MKKSECVVLINSNLGAKGHPGIPLIFAWGLHIGLSYQRPGFKQATLEYMIKNGIEEPAKWGATIVDFYPSNKEKTINDGGFEDHAEPPKYLFREHPDDDQDCKWNIDHFLAFNRQAHENDMLISWDIHQWYRYPHVKRAKIMWKLLQELGLHVCDPMRQGWKECIDGFMVEGSFFVPEAVCEYLWPFHPGIYYREAMFNYNYTVPNFINPGYHLTDGRDLICDEDYSIKPPESLIGNPDVWKGKDHHVKYGRQWVSNQLEARDLKCTEKDWEGYGGMATVDLVVEQINNYARAKGINWEGACTTAIRYLNEAIISQRMRRYIFGMSQDPVRCAVSGEITSTSKTGKYPRVEEPEGTYFLQNNNFRLYCRTHDGSIGLQFDPNGLADHTKFLSGSILNLSDNLLDSLALPEQKYWGAECHSVEEAGALATLRQRIEYRCSHDAMSEFRWFTTESDSPWIHIKVNRLFQTGEYASRTVLNLDDYSLKREKTEVLIPGEIVRFESDVKPGISILLPKGDVESIEWVDQKLLFISDKARSLLLSFFIFLGDEEITREEGRWLSEKPEVSLASGEAEVRNPTRFRCSRAVHVLDPPEGVYWVEEEGWWMCRPGQHSREEMETDFCKAVLSAGGTSSIRSYGLLEGVCKPGWGCQYMLLVKDASPRSNGGSVVVKVVDISPKVFAPRIEFAHTVCSAKLDGRPWYYFDEKFVFLPQERRCYDVSVRYGNPEIPHLITTFAKVTDMRWEDGVFSIVCDWNEWSEGGPERFRYYAAVKLEGRRLNGVEGCEEVRRIPLFRSIESYELSGKDSIVHMVPRSYNDTPFKPLNPNGGVVVRFLPGTINMHIEK